MTGAALIELFRSKTAITNKLGSNPLRLYPQLLPQDHDVYPAAAYRIASVMPTPDFDGRSAFDFWMIDIHLYGHDFDAVEDLSSTIRSAIVDTSGTYAGVPINDITYTNEAHDYLDDLRLYTISPEYQINTRR